MSQKKLSRKKFLKEFNAVTEVWLQANEMSATVQLSEAISLRDSLASLLDEKQLLDEHQNVLKGALGRAKKAGESPTDLITQMRESADKLKSLNAVVNSTADLLLGVIFEEQAKGSDRPPSFKMPEHFCAPDWLDSPSPSEISEHGKSDRIHSCNSAGDASASKLAVVSEWQILENLTDEQWNSFTTANAQATHYHQHQWRRIIANNFPQQHWYVGALNENGDVEGVMSLVHMSSPVSGNYLLSMPWLIYGGSLSRNGEVSELLAEYAKTKMNEFGCSHIELRQIHTRPDWQRMPGKVAMLLALPPTIEELNTGFDSSLRAQVRAAAAHGPSVEFGGAELLADFYDVFCEKMRDLGTPVYHKGFFADIALAFPESTTVVVVKLNGRAVAAAFLVKYRDTIEIPWAAASKKYNRQAVNMFMYHQILEYSIVQGFQYFDFGRSTVNTGTYQFKKQWGAKPLALGWHRYPGAANEEGDSVGGEKGWKFKLAIAVWKNLPVWLTKIIGPPVSRLLPW